MTPHPATTAASLVAGVLVAGAALGAAPAEAPTVKRYALIVANNRSLDEGVRPLAFADDDAIKYEALFRAAGARVSLLAVLDRDAQRRFPTLARAARPPRQQTLRAELATLFEQLAADAAAGIETHFYFVYSGHGHVGPNREGYLNLLDARFSRRDLYRDVIARSPATWNHVILDACNAYFMVHKRGDKPDKRGDYRAAVHAFLRTEELASYPNTGVILARSSESETHEWSRWEAGIFSHELRSALLGAGDADGDGQVSYAEAAACVEAANAGIANPRARLRVHYTPPAARVELALLPLRALNAPHWVRIAPAAAGRYHVEDAAGVRVLDLHSSAEQAVRVALVGEPPFFLRTGEREAKIGDPLGDVDVAALAFQPLRAGVKGGVERSFRRDLYRLPYGVGFLRGALATHQRSVAWLVERDPETAAVPIAVRLETATKGSPPWLATATREALGHLLAFGGQVAVSEPGRAQATAVIALDVRLEIGEVVVSARLGGRAGRDEVVLRTERRTIDRLYAELDWLAFALRRVLVGAAAQPPQTPSGELRLASPDAYSRWQAMHRAMDADLRAEATTQMRQALQLNATFALAPLDLALWLYDWEADRPAAKKLLAEALTAIPDRPFERLYARAARTYLMGDMARAAALFEELTTSYPLEGSFHYRLVDALSHQRQYDVYRKLSDRRADIDPIYAATYRHWDLAAWSSSQARHAEAIASARRFARAVPWRRDALLMLGHVQRAAGAYADALATYQRAGSLFPSPWLGQCAAGVLFKQGRLAATIAALEPSLTAKSPVVVEEALMILVDAAYELAAPAAVIEREVAPRLAAHPRRAEMLAAQAMVAVHRGELDKATALARRFLESEVVHWRHYYAYWVQLEVTLARGQTETALQQAGKVCRHMEIEWYAPDECDLLLAQTALRAKVPERALAPLERALAYNSQRGRTNALLARAHEALGHARKARRHNKRFLALWADADAGLEVIKRSSATSSSR